MANWKWRGVGVLCVIVGIILAVVTFGILHERACLSNTLPIAFWVVMGLFFWVEPGGT